MFDGFQDFQVRLADFPVMWLELFVDGVIVASFPAQVAKVVT